MLSAFTPFPISVRGCGGKATAYLEMSLVLAKTVWWFDVERPGDERVDGEGEGRSRVTGTKELVVGDQFSSVHTGPSLVFKVREGFGVENLKMGGE